MKKENKTTKKDFELFKKECRKWIKIFSLLRWRVEYEHSDRYPDFRACCSSDLNNGLALISLTIDWKEDLVTKDRVKICAFHEVQELFLTRLASIAGTRFVTKAEVDEATHEIIRTLENVVYPKLK